MMTLTLDTHLPLSIRRAASLEPSLWANGKGASCEVAIAPQNATLDDFVWRASMAQMSADGTFSSFPGIDRTLILLGGAGMELDVMRRTGSEEHHALREPLAAFDFSGDTPPTATLVDGPTHDFNLMVRRDLASGQVDVWRGPGVFTLPEDVVLIFVVRETVALMGADTNDPAPIPLDPCDSVKLNGILPQALSLDIPAQGVVLAVQVRVHPEPVSEPVV